MIRNCCVGLIAGVISLFMSYSSAAFGAELPRSTQKMLKDLKLNSSILRGLDQELEVPDDWMKKAKDEAKVRIIATWDHGEAKVLLAPFRERYPFLEIEYLHRSTRQSRVVKTLMAYSRGKIVTDVMTSLGASLHSFEDMSALEDLAGIRGLENLPSVIRDPQRHTVAKEVNYWCMSYNTRFVKKESLPAKWEDLLTEPAWRDQNLALANRPQQWMIQLWGAKGEGWTKKFLARLFSEVKPQLRKEGLSAVAQLAAAGEFHAAIPTSQSHVVNLLDVGAPIGYHCPEPVPAALSDASILRGAHNVYAAKIFINWLLSKEGQIAQYVATRSIPSHTGLQRPEFVPFADKILGRQIVYRLPKLQRELGPELDEFWNSLWLRGGK